MISVQNRLPEPGKENRVSITPDNGSAVEGVLAYADDATQEGTLWNRKTAQLLQGDIRTYPVREGQSISAGDVVDIDDDGYIFKTNSAKAAMYIDALDNTYFNIFACPAEGGNVVFARQYRSSSSSSNGVVFSGVRRLENGDLTLLRSETVYHTNTDTVPCISGIDCGDKALITFRQRSARAYYVGKSDFVSTSISINGGLSGTLWALGKMNDTDIVAVDNYSNYLRVRFGTIEETSIDLTGISGQSDASEDITMKLIPKIVAIDENTAVVVFADNRSPYYIRGMVFSRKTGSVQCGDVTDLITEDVKFFDVCLNDGKLYLSYAINGAAYIQKATISDLALTPSGDPQKISADEDTASYAALASVDGDIVACYSDLTVHTGTVLCIDVSGDTIVVHNNADEKYVFSQINASDNSYGFTDIQIVPVADSRFYVVTNPNVVSMRLKDKAVSGDFVDTSTMGIALSDGDGGESVPVGLSGNVQYAAASAGEDIVNPEFAGGVIAHSPQDGWLTIKSEWEKGYVVGAYTGDGTANRHISLGFRPRVVMLFWAGNFIRTYGNASGYNAWTGICIDGDATSKYDIYEDGFYNVSNDSGLKYNYIAFR